jgi:hypothetical protein
MFIYGGKNLNNISLSDLWYFNIINETWKEVKIENLPNLYSTISFYIDNSIFLIGIKLNIIIFKC